MKCACGCEPTEEELLAEIANKRQRWEQAWLLLTEDERKQGDEKHQKALARLDGQVRQVEARLALRLALSPEPS